VRAFWAQEKQGRKGGTGPPVGRPVRREAKKRNKQTGGDNFTSVAARLATRTDRRTDRQTGKWEVEGREGKERKDEVEGQCLAAIIWELFFRFRKRVLEVG